MEINYLELQVKKIVEAHGVEWQPESKLQRDIAYAIGQERIKVWKDAIRLVCPLCKMGYPFQRNKIWHNDMNGRDTMVNNCCLAPLLREQLDEAIITLVRVKS